MSENEQPSEEDKNLALTYALVALVKSLKNSKNLDTDHLFQNLGGMATKLERSGHDEAAKYMRTDLSDLFRRL